MLFHFIFRRKLRKLKLRSKHRRRQLINLIDDLQSEPSYAVFGY